MPGCLFCSRYMLFSLLWHGDFRKLDRPFQFGSRHNWPLLNRSCSFCQCLFWTVSNLRLFSWPLDWLQGLLSPACSTSLVTTLCCIFCNRLLTFQVFRVLLTTGLWAALPAMSAVSNLIHDFEQAPGQQINRGKSALIPVRQFSDDERASCLLLWYSDIRDSSR